MERLEVIEREAIRLGEYQEQRRVSLLAIAVLQVANYAALEDQRTAPEVARALSDFAGRATTVVQTEHDGLVVRWSGGQLLAVFAEPTAAVRAVVELSAGDLPLKACVHLGQVALQPVGLHLDAFARHAHRAVCVANAAQPGEILATEPIADNVRGVDGTDEPSFVFARRGRVRVDGLDHPLPLFALTKTRAAPSEHPRPDTFIELDVDGKRTVLFDASVDRRIVLGRSSSCDVPLREEAASRKHAMILYDRPRWVLHDLGSTNGTYLGDRHLTEQAKPLSVGDAIRIGNTVVTVTDLGLGESAPVLRVDLRSGEATYEGRPLPLSAAEFIWFSQLACARACGEGWVVAGQDGHAQLRAFAKPLFSRPWATAVRTRPLLDLIDGRDIDDEDLRNLRGKAVQKLKRFGVPALIPDAKGKHDRRLPLAPTMIEIIE
jgi:class 3 adenylate cyclase